MDFKYLLDTNILSELIINPVGKIRAKIEEVGESRVSTSIIVASEIRYGCKKRKSARLTRQANAILGAIPILDLEKPVDEFYGEIRSNLEGKGTPIGPNDLFIAAQTQSLGLTLVTNNLKKFRRVKGLKAQNWL